MRHWIYVIRLGLLPLVFAIVTALIFLAVPQAREALFGAVGPEFFRHTAFPMVRVQSRWLMAGIVWMGLVIWYTTRLLVSIDWRNRIPASAAGDISAAAIAQPMTHYPRLLGAISTALLAFAVFDAYSPPSLAHTVHGVISTLLPLLTVIAWQRVRSPAWFRPALTALTLAVTAGLVYVEANKVSQVEIGLQSLLLFILCCVPAALYTFFVWRRRLIKAAIGQLPRAAARLAAADTTWVMPFLTGAAGIVLIFLFGVLNVAMVRSIGSCAILLAFLGSVTCILTAASLFLRRRTRRTPGVVAVTVVALVVLVAGLRIHLPEPLGYETVRLPEATVAASPPLATRQTQDILVNAYGGGLRAGLYTAQVLAALDDRTCGGFGQRLQTLSGVSGGSVGIAVYLSLRQELVAHGGWGACDPRQTKPLLRDRVEAALKLDHLSPVVAQLLSFDLLPGTHARRGQALLDSWQDAVESALVGIDRQHASTVSKVGLARPLRELNGGMSPSPLVLFNTTDADSGMRIWLSNNQQWGEGADIGALNPRLQVGQAVLHSARFPLVSPAGHLQLNHARIVVDGGYADNSGANSLLPVAGQRPPAVWLNIDGNPPERCGSQAAPPATLWSGARALLAVRTSQAELAELALTKALPAVPNRKLQMNLDQAFQSSMPDQTKRCEFIRGLRSAPLGWYMTSATTGDQNITITAAVNKACEVLGGLCK